MSTLKDLKEAKEELISVMILHCGQLDKRFKLPEPVGKIVSVFPNYQDDRIYLNAATEGGDIVGEGSLTIEELFAINEQLAPVAMQTCMGKLFNGFMNNSNEGSDENSTGPRKDSDENSNGGLDTMMAGLFAMLLDDE